MSKIAVIHGVNSPAGTWEQDFQSLEEFGELHFMQWPSRRFIGDYVAFIGSESYREDCADALDDALGSNGFDLVVTHSFGQVQYDNWLLEYGDIDYLEDVPVINLGGPFTNPVIRIPLMSYMHPFLLNRHVVINRADNIPTIMGKYNSIPHKSQHVFTEDIKGEDHNAPLYLRQPYVRNLIERCLDVKP